MKSKVMTIANNLVKQGMSRSAAMVQAWITVKLRRIETKTAGVTHGNRQKLLARLTRYAPEDITIQLQREKNNPADENAVQVVAAVIDFGKPTCSKEINFVFRNQLGKGSAVMGYLNRQLAAAIAPLLDKGKRVVSAFKAITGGADYFLNYGLNISIACLLYTSPSPRDS